MKLFNLKKVFTAVAMCISVQAIAQEVNTTTSVSYPNLHDPVVAESAYSSFADGQGEDPFEDLVNGYKDGYTTDVETNIRPLQYELLRETSIDQFQSNANYFGGISDSRDEQRAEIYADSLGEDGEFDAVAYAESYALFLDSQKSEVDVYMTDSFNNLVDIMDENNTALSELSTNVGQNTTRATSNLLSIMATKGYDSKLDMYEEYANSIASISNLSAQADSTITLASTFSDDCGGACSFPELPPEIEPEEPPSEPPVITDPPLFGCFDGRVGYWGWRDGSRYYYKCP